MAEFLIIKEKIERRTYLKGRFTGKFIGYLDAENSDLKNENFYDLEITEAKVFARKTDFRTWQEGDEFEEFQKAERFLTKLPDLIDCEVTYEDGSVKHFNLHINEPKLENYKLFNQLYEHNKLFAAIEGDFSGYLKHFDTEERREEITPPKPTIYPINTKISDIAASRAESVGSGQPASNNGRAAANSGCAPIGFSTLSSGCFSLLAILFAVYLATALILLILSPLAKLYAGIGLIISAVFSVIFPIFFVGIFLYLFVKLQSKLSPVWIWIFRLIIVFLIFFLFLN